jgi:hypothetical protein
MPRFGEIGNIQTQAVHQITINGADRRTSIWFRDPPGLRIEGASDRFGVPEG